MPEYRVKQGDCIESIAYKFGLFWETVWNDQENAQLKDIRDTPNTLLPDDIVHIMDKREQLIDAATEQTHRFRRKGVPSKLHVFLQNDEGPLADMPYTLVVDGKVINDSGFTSSEGEVEEPITPSAEKAILTVGQGEDEQIFEIKLGYVDPLDEVSGVQQRLTNIGFYCSTTGKLDEETISAIKAFQQNHDLKPSGELDKATFDALKDEHKC